MIRPFALSAILFFVSNAQAGNFNCPFDGTTVLNLKSVTAYSSRTVPAGSTCASQSRRCWFGMLQGSASYAYKSCTVQQPVCTTKTIDFNTLAAFDAPDIRENTFNGVKISSNRDLMNMSIYDATPAWAGNELFVAIPQGTGDEYGYYPRTILDNKISIILPQTVKSAEVQLAFWPSYRTIPVLFSSAGQSKVVDFMWFNWAGLPYPQYLMAVETVHFDYPTGGNQIDITNYVQQLTNQLEIKINNIKYTVCQ